jgi:hypothetical protein
MNMADAIVPSEQSPFDTIRRFDEDGDECWYGRELMSLLGYAKWQRFQDAIDRAELSCQNSNLNPDKHFEFLPEAVKTPGGGRPGDNYKLSRHACHLIAMNGDPRKDEIALAQHYFSGKVREAEVAIPALSEELQKLQLVNENLKMQLALVERTDSMAIMHGVPTTLLLLGKGDHVEEVEKPTIEVIDSTHNVKFSGQTLKQIAEYLNKKYGTKFKSGADVKRFLERSKLGHLIAQTPRTVMGEYVPDEHLDFAYQALTTGDRQRLIGELT